MTTRTESTYWLCVVVMVLAFSAVAEENGGKDVVAEAQIGKNGRPIFVRRATERSPLVRQNTNFALRMYCAQVQSHQEENFVFSPVSVTQGLSLVYAGAGGATAREMKNVMQLPGEPSDEQLHGEIAALGSPGSGEGYTLEMANGLFLDSDQVARKEYIELLEGAYGAEPTPMDFAVNTDATRMEINEWVREATNGKITDLLPKGSVTEDTVIVLANALHFKADWDKVFDKLKTHPKRFFAGGSGNTTVDMMELESEFFHGSLRELGVQVLELPYAGGEFSMFVVLPLEQDGLLPVENEFCGLADDSVGSIVTAFEDRMIHKTMRVTMPKFTVQGDMALQDMLPDLGMNALFSLAAANLSGISNETALYVESAFHKAFIEVNEEGTEAAAATGSSVAVRSLPPDFTVDRPFMFYVIDNRNKALVMLGRVWDPKKTP